MSDILILTASFGMGHKSVSKALKEILENEKDNNGDLDIEIVDLFDIITPSLNKHFVKMYDYLADKKSSIYNAVYEVKKNYKRNMFDESMYIMYSKKFYEYIKDKNPRLIISTFPMCSGFVSNAKKNYNIDIPLITVITDVVDSWEWIHEYTNMYFVPSQEVKSKLIKKNIDKNIIKITGIPVKSNFIKKVCSKKEDHNLLIMASVMNKLKLDEETLRKLDNNTSSKIIIVTGKNLVLYRKLKKQKYANIEVIGFSNEVDKLMDKSAAIITKPGGVTLFEAINKEVPLMVIDSDVGQEKENINFVKNNKIGYVLSKQDNVIKKIQEFINDHHSMNKISKNMCKVKRSMKTAKVKEYVLHLI